MGLCTRETGTRASSQGQGAYGFQMARSERACSKITDILDLSIRI